MSLTDETDAKIARYILEASRGERLLAQDELGEIQEHVADAWYNLAREQRIPRDVVGSQWRGRVLQPSDVLLTDVVHYLKHIVVRQEWPPGMAFAAYRESLREGNA